MILLQHLKPLLLQLETLKKLLLLVRIGLTLFLIRERKRKQWGLTQSTDRCCCKMALVFKIMKVTLCSQPIWNYWLWKPTINGSNSWQKSCKICKGKKLISKTAKLSDFVGPKPCTSLLSLKQIFQYSRHMLVAFAAVFFKLSIPLNRKLLWEISSNKVTNFREDVIRKRANYRYHYHKKMILTKSNR